MSGYDFSRVSPTALLPLLGRGDYTDIPYAKEMADYLKSRVSLPPEATTERYQQSYAPFFEARFKSVNSILTEQHADQILELASGFSPRGMDWSQRCAVYVETDLPGMIEQKREIIRAILGSLPPNLLLCPASVLDRDALLAACSHFRKEPVAITTEGLLRYLTFPEKAQLAANVHAILGKFGGAWITPDIHLRQWTLQRVDAAFHKRQMEEIGRDVDPNYFDDLAHARAFFESCGFAVEERPLLEGVRDSMVSLPHVSADLREQLEERRTFILRARGSD